MEAVLLSLVWRPPIPSPHCLFWALEVFVWPGSNLSAETRVLILGSRVVGLVVLTSLLVVFSRNL